MNPQQDEHLRDSAPDNSRFDGFDRGDSGRDEDPGYSDLDCDPAEPQARKPSLAKRMLVSLGLLAGRGLPQMPQLQMPTAIVPVHTTTKQRREQRALCRELGRRQYRRATCRSYALKAEAALSDLA